MSRQQLSLKTLQSISSNVAVPRYNIDDIAVGIAHVSLGAFHRAHMAVYTDAILSSDNKNWGIFGIGALETDSALVNKLQKQDNLYSVMTKDRSGNTATVIGSIRETSVLPTNPKEVLEKLVSSDIKILSLTITEKGYCLDPQTGKLDPNHPMIKHDTTNIANPKSAIGLIVAALQERKKRGIPPFTVLSCDNLPHNGDKTAAAVQSLARLIDLELANWIAQNVAFPNTMVDRITPSTSPADIETLSNTFDYIDEAPVACEPFMQWVLEDNFTMGRPAWEKAGAQFVSDVAPYELAKIRLLNVPHTIFSYPAFLQGFEWVADGASDSLLSRYVRKVMDDEITPTVPSVPGIDLDTYKQTIIERFANPAIKDTWVRICSDGSQKIANQLLPIIRERLSKDTLPKGLILLLAYWFHYLRGEMDGGKTYTIDDPKAKQLQAIAQNRVGCVQKFLEAEDIFGTDLGKNSAFVAALNEAYDAISKNGLIKPIENYISSTK